MCTWESWTEWYIRVLLVIACCEITSLLWGFLHLGPSEEFAVLISSKWLGIRWLFLFWLWVEERCFAFFFFLVGLNHPLISERLFLFILFHILVKGNNPWEGPFPSAAQTLLGGKATGEGFGSVCFRLSCTFNTLLKLGTSTHTILVLVASSVKLRKEYHYYYINSQVVMGHKWYCRCI